MDKYKDFLARCSEMRVTMEEYTAAMSWAHLKWPGCSAADKADELLCRIELARIERRILFRALGQYQGEPDKFYDGSGYVVGGSAPYLGLTSPGRTPAGGTP